MLVICTAGTTTDDAFIPLRFARNVIEGHGPVFNPGEAVEGFSSPLHLLVSIFVVAVPVSQKLLLAKLASVLFGAAAVWCALRTIAALRMPWWAQVVGALLVGTSVPLAVASSNGLETSLVAALVTATVLVVVRWGSDRWVLLGLLGSGIVLARPEGVLTVALMAAATAAIAERGRILPAIRWAAFPAATAALVLAARLAYYGDVVPNTYWAKRLPAGTAYHAGIDYLRLSISPGTEHPTWSLVWCFGVVALVASSVLLASGVWAVAVRRERLAVAVGAVAAQVAFVLVAGGDWMGQGRFIAPVVPVAAVLQARGAWHLESRFRRLVPRSAAAPVVLALVVCPIALTFPHTPRYPVWNLQGASDEDLVSRDANAWIEAMDLFDCAGAGDLVAYSEMGYVPWSLPRLRFLDIRGLMSRRVAKGDEPHHTWGVQDPDWRRSDSSTVREVLRRRPVLVVTYTTEGPESFGGGRYVRVDDGPQVPGYTVYRRSDHNCDPTG